MAGNGITLVIVSTETYQLGLQAVRNSVQAFDFDKILILSDQAEAWGEFPVTKIDRFASGRDYNKFIIAELYKYIETDYFLVIQYDGFVLRGDQFSPHFYHYDYIGAPWPFHANLTVGNGGFSWRSRRFAEAGAKIFAASGAAADDPIVEDSYLCRTNRILLEEKYGMHYASEGVAEHFSVESGTRHFPTFGFHGPWHLPKVYSDRLDWLLDNLPLRLLENEALWPILADHMYNVSIEHHRKLTKLKKSVERSKAKGGARPWLAGW